MTPVEKQIRNHAMRAYHAALRLRQCAEGERGMQEAALKQARHYEDMAEQARTLAHRHAAQALADDKRAAEKDDEQKQWEALLPPVPAVGADVSVRIHPYPPMPPEHAAALRGSNT